MEKTMSNKESSSINSLTEQLSNLYTYDTTLGYLKHFEEERKAFMELSSLISSWQEPTIQDKILDMEKTIASTYIQDAFKTHADYELYANPILSSIHDKNYNSLQEALKIATEPLLNNDYIQTIKATDLFSDAIDRAKSIGLTENIDSYTSKLSDSISQYENNNKLNAAQNILGLTSMIDTDIFQKEMKLIDNQSITNKILKEVEQADNYKIKEPNYQNRMLDISLPHIPKYEDTIMGKADKQLEVLERLSNYMIQQNKNLEIQNDIATAQKNSLKEQNELIKDQVKETSKTSFIALGTAILSIIVSSIITVYVFLEEDKSDNKNHIEVKKILQANNNNKILNDLLLELKEENKNSTIIIEKLVKENQYFKEILKLKK